MSYSFESKCPDCKKAEAGCIDGKIIANAVNLIHTLPSRFEKGQSVGPHQGGGSVVHSCTYGFVPKDEVKKEG